MIKREVGDRLRYTQLIGTPVLLGLFLSLLALYIFLKMNARLTNKELDDLKDSKSKLAATRGHYLDKEKAIIAKEHSAAVSSDLSNNVWLFITIVVWLLMPFFKPIDDEKIDLTDPFKSLTFSDPDNPLNPKHKDDDQPSHIVKDTTLILRYVDSIRVVPYSKDTFVRKNYKEYDTVNRVYKFDSGNITQKLDEITKMLHFLVPPIKQNK